MASPMHPFPSLCFFLFAATLGSVPGAEPPPESPEFGAVRREFEKRTGDALRPVYSWYEGELERLERSFTTRGNLDGALYARQERERFKSEQAQTTPGALKVALDDSRWKYNGDENTQLVFKKDGNVECAPWARVGWAHRWQASGPKTVTCTVLRPAPWTGKQWTLTFSPDLKSFEGTAVDGAKISPSPRVK